MIKADGDEGEDDDIDGIPKIMGGEDRFGGH